MLNVTCIMMNCMYCIDFVIIFMLDYEYEKWYFKSISLTCILISAGKIYQPEIKYIVYNMTEIGCGTLNPAV